MADSAPISTAEGDGSRSVHPTGKEESVGADDVDLSMRVQEAEGEDVPLQVTSLVHGSAASFVRPGQCARR